ncbi:MAG: hypothetical protein GY794_22500, partial [bacterium]|nr:hypothetical protein [bacterium]
YSDFKNGPAATRPGVVYAGSNGGMMHGFSETDGEEVLAYIAGNLFSTGSKAGLHYLTDPNYVHKYYNDLTPTVSDIYTDLGSGLGWQTILISGQRGGGRGIFALNVTDPFGFSEANADKLVVWEFSDADDADLGFTYSRPQIGMANNGRWVAIFGNGYNDSGDGKAKLFILDIAAGADGSWDAGDYIEITTNSGSTTDRNGLATPSLADLDGNGTIDRIWAGDLKGQMWAFDLTSSISSSWDIPGSQPMFTTKGNRPITVKPALAKHPTISDDGSNDPNVLVMFGTGQYLTNSDKSSTDDNHFYGVWDRGDTGLTHSSLVEQTFQSGYTDVNGDPVRVLSRNTINYSGGDYGFFIELPENGERSVTNAVVRGKNVFFNTFVPVDDPCSVGGFGFRFAVDMITGGSPENITFDTNNDGVIDASDAAQPPGGGGAGGVGDPEIVAIRQEGFLPEPVFIENLSYTADEPDPVPPLPEPPVGRFSWQELIQ